MRKISQPICIKCLILCSKILLKVLRNTSLKVLLPWQHTGFQTSPILKAFLATFSVLFSYLQMVPCMYDPAGMLKGQLQFVALFNVSRVSRAEYESVRIVLPFKEQKSADSVRKQLKNLGTLLNIDLCPVFISRKVGGDLKHKEIKPALINEQSVVYKFECGWCDASYVGYTRRHLYQRIDEHKRSGSIFNHSQSQHPSRTITSNMFHILKKCSSKFDCLLYKMFLIPEHKQCLNIQSDLIKAKLFTQPLGTKNLNWNINILVIC